jgi:PAS domain S-box-containing protein
VVGAHQVDEQVRLQRALKETEDRYRALFDGVPVGLYRTTPGGEILEANPALVRMLGFHDPAQLRGVNVHELVDPEARLAEERLLAEHGTVRTALRLRRADGTTIWVEDNARAVRDENDVVVAYEGSLVDVTERTRDEATRDLLARAGEVLGSSLEYETTLATVARFAVQSIADYCVVDVLDEAGSVRRVAATHRDPAREELVQELLRYPADPSGSAHVPTALRTGEPSLVREVTAEHVVAAARDEAHRQVLQQLGPTSFMAVPLIARGRSLGVVIFASTRAEQRYDKEDLAVAVELARRCALAIDNARLYADAREAIRARDEFLAIAAHELRTPVTGVKSGTQLLLRRLSRSADDAGGLRHIAELIDDATDNLVSLTQDLIDVAKIRRGQLPLRPERLDLGSLLAKIGGRFREHLEGKHELRLELPGVPVEIEADAVRIEQVVTNLLQNAAKYSPAGGDIRLRCWRQDEGAAFDVTDPGIGLPPGTAESIFELFGRAANAERMHLPGLGLGLHICRDIVQRHGGRIWAESAGEHQGTTVTVWLPAA